MEFQWSDLPSDILGLISQFAATPGDQVRFSAVCKSWRLSATAASAKKPRRLSPLLALASGGRGPYRAYSLHSRQLVDLKLDISWPQGSYCCGCSHGRLTILTRDLHISLLNPLTGAVASLPPPRFPGRLDLILTSTSALSGEPSYVARSPGMPDYSCSFNYIRRYLLSKIVLSSEPISSRCAAAAIFGFAGELAFCPPGGRSWTVAAPITIDGCGPFHDVVFHRDRGKFYAVDSRLRVYTYSLSGELEALPPGPIVFDTCKEAVSGICEFGVVERVYLAESRGNLLMINRFFSDEIGKTGFLVYRLEFCGSKVRAVKMTVGLEGQALFLGKNATVLVSSRDFVGCRSNCIYFADYLPGRNGSFLYGGPDFGIFNLETESIEGVTCCTVDRRTMVQQGIWLIPRE